MEGLHSLPLVVRNGNTMGIVLSGHNAAKLLTPDRPSRLATMESVDRMIGPGSRRRHQEPFDWKKTLAEPTFVCSTLPAVGVTHSVAVVWASGCSKLPSFLRIALCL